MLFKNDSNELKKKKPLYVILSEVEISPSEERGEIKERKRRRDLRTNLGGFLQKMLLPFDKPPKVIARSRFALWLALLRRYSLHRSSTSSG